MFTKKHFFVTFFPHRPPSDTSNKIKNVTLHSKPRLRRLTQLWSRVIEDRNTMQTLPQLMRASFYYERLRCMTRNPAIFSHCITSQFTPGERFCFCFIRNAPVFERCVTLSRGFAFVSTHRYRLTVNCV